MGDMDLNTPLKAKASSSSKQGQPSPNSLARAYPHGALSLGQAQPAPSSQAALYPSWASSSLQGQPSPSNPTTFYPHGASSSWQGQHSPSNPPTVYPHGASSSREMAHPQGPRPYIVFLYEGSNLHPSIVQGSHPCNFNAMPSRETAAASGSQQKQGGEHYSADGEAQKGRIGGSTTNESTEVVGLPIQLNAMPMMAFPSGGTAGPTTTLNYSMDKWGGSPKMKSTHPMTFSTAAMVSSSLAGSQVISDLSVTKAERKRKRDREYARRSRQRNEDELNTLAHHAADLTKEKDSLKQRNDELLLKMSLFIDKIARYQQLVTDLRKEDDEWLEKSSIIKKLEEIQGKGSYEDDCSATQTHLPNLD